VGVKDTVTVDLTGGKAAKQAKKRRRGAARR